MDDIAIRPIDDPAAPNAPGRPSTLLRLCGWLARLAESRRTDEGAMASARAREAVGLACDEGDDGRRNRIATVASEMQHAEADALPPPQNLDVIALPPGATSHEDFGEADLDLLSSLGPYARIVEGARDFLNDRARIVEEAGKATDAEEAQRCLLDDARWEDGRVVGKENLVALFDANVLASNARVREAMQPHAHLMQDIARAVEACVSGEDPTLGLAARRDLCANLLRKLLKAMSVK